ncbi:MAG: AI-2E family transporter [Planctomycetota bacterium]|jgi:predicted PurR-regulated permease PerM
MNDSVEKPSAMRALAAAAFFVIVVAGMQAAASLLVPFLLAAFIAVIAAPPFLGLQRRGVPAAAALAIMILVMVIVAFVGVRIVRSSLDAFSSNYGKYEDRLKEQIDDLWEWLDAKGVSRPDETVAETFDPKEAFRYVGVVATALSNLLAQAFLILLVAIFILFEAAVLPEKVRALPNVSDATWAKIERVIDEVRRYMSLKTVVSLLTGVLVTLFTAVIGVDSPMLLGLLAFVLNYVPNIGSFIAAIPGVLLAFIEFGLGTAAVTGAGYVVINAGVGNVLEPRLMGRGLGLSPLVILISMIFWGWVLGPVGMLLSVPLTMTVKIALESADETRWIALLMGAGIPEPRQTPNCQVDCRRCPNQNRGWGSLGIRGRAGLIPSRAARRLLRRGRLWFLGGRRPVTPVRARNA